jgi:hypothetical protein
MLKNKIAYWSGIIIASLVIGFSLQLARAWQSPPGNPPAGNVGAPITTGGAAQIKTGGFTDVNYVQAPGMYAQIFYDDVDRSYYVDPNSQSEFKGLYLRGGYEYLSPDSAIADVDSGGNWMGYYLKPSESSRMNYSVFNNQYTYGWIQADGGFKFAPGAATGKVLTSSGSDGWAYWGDPASISEADTLQSVTNRGDKTTKNIYAPALVDIDDQNYFVNPGNWSSFKHGGFSSGVNNTGAWFNGDAGSGLTYGAWAGGDAWGVYGYETDSQIYGISAYGGYGFYSNGPIYTGSYVLGDHISGQYFSDSNNPSNYYVDPSSWSSLYHVTVLNGLTLPFGNYGSNQVLISDSNGGAYWANPCAVVNSCSCN